MKKLIIFFCYVVICITGEAQLPYSKMTPAQRKLFDEHIVFGQPDSSNAPVFIRQGYIMRFNDKYRIPKWVAYHIIPDYLKTPAREGKFLSFSSDPDMKNPVANSDYTGTGYAKGHMAPYFTMGGDRNKNGIYAVLGKTNSDKYDEQTVFQANYLSNIAPQRQSTLNGPGGPWYALETVIRKVLVEKNHMELNVIVGGIVSDPKNYPTLKNKYHDSGIAIPDRFFQVLFYKDKLGNYMTAGFLFPHVDSRSDLPYNDLIDYIVPVDSIEKVSGLDFFKTLDKKIQDKIEKQDNKEFWINHGFSNN